MVARHQIGIRLLSRAIPIPRAVCFSCLLLRRIGRDAITVHGFRSTFRDWAGESTSFPREVVEHAMAQQHADKAEAAYQRGTLFPKRVKLMAAWAAYCASPVADDANVSRIPVRGLTGPLPFELLHSMEAVARQHAAAPEDSKAPLFPARAGLPLK